MNWAPFALAEPGKHGEAPRSISALEGIGDRLRAAAFAEFQAREAFLWAADKFEDAPPGLREAWRALAAEEEKHMGWLLARMKILGISLTDRKVSDHLWVSLISCSTAREFAVYMANAEERGKLAGERFYESLRDRDPVTGEIFRKIAEEETSHIQLARKYY